MTGHARLAPSSAGRWVECPGSVVLQEQFPERRDDTTAADEGTAAHALASHILNGNRGPFDAPPDMLDHVDLFVDTVRATRVLAKVEARVECQSIGADVWGTCDAYSLDYLKKEAHIFDFKYGYGLVEVYENWQLLAYASGIYDLIGDEAIDWTYNLTIVQPRAYHPQGPVRSWRLAGPEIRNYTRVLRTAAEAALGIVPDTVPGPHCKHCSARFVCPALRDTTLATLDMLGDATPFELPPDALGREVALMRRAQEQIEARLSGLEEEAMAQIRAGKAVPGWTIDHPPGRVHWTAPVAEVFALGELFNIPLAKPPEPITPTQAQKAGVPAEMVRTISERKPGTPKLVPITTTDASRVFGSKQ